MVSSTTLSFPITGTPTCLLATIYCPTNSLKTSRTITFNVPISIYFRANKTLSSTNLSLGLNISVSSINGITCSVYKDGQLDGQCILSIYNTSPYSTNKYISVNSGVVDFAFEYYCYNITATYTTSGAPLNNTYTFNAPISYTISNGSIPVQLIASSAYPVKHGIIVGSSIKTSSLSNCYYNFNSLDTINYLSASITAENNYISCFDNGVMKASINTDGALSSVQPFVNMIPSANAGFTYNTSFPYLTKKFDTIFGGTLTGFNVSTGIFTAPANGLYLFTLSLFVYGGSSFSPGRYLTEYVNDVGHYLAFNNLIGLTGYDNEFVITTHHYLLAGQTHYYFLESGQFSVWLGSGHTDMKITRLS